MELKDAILSTLAEIEDNIIDETKTSGAKTEAPKQTIAQTLASSESKEKTSASEIEKTAADDKEQKVVLDMPKAPFIAIEESVIPEEVLANADEMDKFLLNLRERILVLFEGLLSMQTSIVGDTAQVEKKLDLTVNFLEYLLASIEEKLDKSQE